MIYSVPLILGVTLISFVLMVYFGPDKTYELIGKNATLEEIANIRHQLGYDRPFFVRYVEYLRQIVTLDLGYSDSSGESVVSILARTVPISLSVEIPGFIIGNMLAISIALFAVYFRGQWQDRLVMTLSVIGMSISVLIIIIVFQLIFCSTYGLNLFPVQGWDSSSLSQYLYYVTVPTLVGVFVALGYNTRFYRAIFAEEMSKDFVRTARAFGAPPATLLRKYVLANALVPVITRLVLSIPYLLIGGSLLVETYFGIPGVGLVTYEAITSGDQPVLKAIVALTALLYVLFLTLTDILYQFADPRIRLDGASK